MEVGDWVYFRGEYGDRIYGRVVGFDDECVLIDDGDFTYGVLAEFVEERFTPTN